MEAAAPPPDGSHIAKGKRTKRLRPHSPVPFTIIPPSTITNATQEEEDTAKCLILLAQGHFLKHNNSNKRSYYHHENETKDIVGAAACMYTCKTCDRAFTSFQALGGHRASHKKPKNEKKLPMFEDYPSPKNRINSNSNSLSLQLNNISNTTTNFSSLTPKSSSSPRIHECSYCGAEFTSGQALGGHMRRHRAGPISPYSNLQPTVKSKTTINSQNGLMSLDLNLPAPEQQKTLEEQQNEAAATRLVLSNTTTPVTLVDCHY